MDTPCAKRRSRWTGIVPALAVLLVVVAPAGTGQVPASARTAQEPGRIDGDALVRDLSVIAADSMAGRLAGSDGGRRAGEYLLSRLVESGTVPVGGARTQAFPLRLGTAEANAGVNVLGMIPGVEHPGRYVVVSAHYDHLGVRGGEIYNGADDNASGSAALPALAAYLASNPPRHSFLFVALDAEEIGLFGARAFVSDPPVPLASILLNVNLDMIGHSTAGELYAAGTYHYPVLGPLVEEAASEARITLLVGHDSPELPGGDDWTQLSDHAAFHARDIPFIYFGVEDHEYYHRPTDTVENLTLDFYVDAVETILGFLLIADREGERID